MSDKKKTMFFRVAKGSLVPADSFTLSLLKARKYRMGDLVLVSITKPRNPQFHKYAHILGGILKNNIDDFTGLDEHAVLKRIQLEGNIACDEIAADLGDGLKLYRQARSLSYESMDEGEFQEVMGKICHFVCEKYWTTETPEEIERMAMSYLEAA